MEPMKFLHLLQGVSYLNFTHVDWKFQISSPSLELLPVHSIFKSLWEVTLGFRNRHKMHIAWKGDWSPSLLQCLQLPSKKYHSFVWGGIPTNLPVKLCYFVSFMPKIIRPANPMPFTNCHMLRFKSADFEIWLTQQLHGTQISIPTFTIHLSQR